MATGVYVNIPKNDMPFFRKLSKKMGWTYSTQTEKDVSIRRNAYCSGERSSLLLRKIEIL